MKYLNGEGVSILWTKIKNTFSAIGHKHTKSDITDFPTSLPANGGNAATVNGKTVAVNVPSDAKFTDTVYTHPSSHPANMITGLPTALPANGGNSATVGGYAISVVTSLPSTQVSNTIYFVKKS